MDLAIVDEVRSRVFATRLEGLPKYLPSFPVIPFDEGSGIRYGITDVFGGVQVVVLFGRDDIVFGVVRVIDEPAFPGWSLLMFSLSELSSLVESSMGVVSVPLPFPFSL